MIANEQGVFLRQRFDRLARRYSFNPFTHWGGRSELATLREMIPPPPRPGITPALDFGCGAGRVITLLLETGYRVTGYDLSPGMLAQAKKMVGNRPDVNFVSDPQAVRGPWPLIAALGVLDYYPNSRPLWQEWRRLLSPGGSLLVTVPNAHSPLARVYTLLSRFTCQAYAATLEKLAPAAWEAGFAFTHARLAFPRHWWGHTLVLGFRADAAQAAGRK